MIDQADIARELLQYEIIKEIFSRSVDREIVLKGGFAMRALFGSARRTKDIDLQQDARKHSLPHLQAIMRSAIKATLASGMLTQVTISEPKQTETVARWKVGGKTHAGSIVHLTIEVSRRPLPSDHLVDVPMRASHFSGMSRADETTMVSSYSPEAMAASKTIALLSHHRLAPRDLWDLDILISMNVTPPAEMIAHLQNAESRSLLFDKMEMMTWDLLQSEVIPTLPRSAAKAMTEERFEDMKIRVALAIDKWLTPDPAEHKPHTEMSLS
jgi:predicted nucleotidyltransferase component of viral defense system